MSLHPSFPTPGAPLPGTEPRPRGLFIDRWGTLLRPLDEGCAPRFDENAFTPRAVDALFRACQDGWHIYLIGNEENVARGHVSDADWNRFESELLAFLAGYGVPVQRSYACLDHPEHGTGHHQRDSVYLLPNTGPMYHAMQHDGLVLERSWVIGDGELELVAGWRAGCHLAVVCDEGHLPTRDSTVEPELESPDLATVIAALLQIPR